ncbi:YlaH-like family protein [Virgibacillus salarius]
MNSNFSLVFDFVLEQVGTEYLFEGLYILNLIFSIIAFKLGFARKLPMIKTIVVYIMLAIGVFVLTIFSSVMQMPITESLVVISLVLGIYRLRLHKERTRKPNE